MIIKSGNLLLALLGVNSLSIRFWIHSNLAASFAGVSRKPPKKSLHTPRYDLLLRMLREAREAAGLSQRQAARKLDRTQAYVSKSETGERRVDVVEMVDFLRAYEQEPESFIRKIWDCETLGG